MFDAVAQMQLAQRPAFARIDPAVAGAAAVGAERNAQEQQVGAERLQGVEQAGRAFEAQVERALAVEPRAHAVRRRRLSAPVRA